MQTSIHKSFRDTAGIDKAEAILRSCVHCGFCNATCPTYLQLFDERDGPRGRIYLVKQFLEEGEATESTRTHLDRCLTCRSCETTCPSGVQYGDLIDFGRGLLEEKLPRPFPDRVVRWLLRKTIAYRRRFTFILTVGRFMRPILPRVLRRKIPVKVRTMAWPRPRHERKMLAFKGCVQSAVSPGTNVSAARVLDRLGITLLNNDTAGCCGAVSYHLGNHEEGKDFFRKNINAWWPLVESGVESLVISASGCGSMIKDYGKILSTDPEYAQKAAKVSELARDLSEIVSAEDLSGLGVKDEELKVAIHCPCSLQHSQGLPSSVDQVMTRLGFSLVQTKDKHICCGSAGTYSTLQANLSQRLLDQKVSALSIDNPDVIVTANIGCQIDLNAHSEIPVRHWIEVVNDTLKGDH